MAGVESNAQSGRNPRYPSPVEGGSVELDLQVATYSREPGAGTLIPFDINGKPLPAIVIHETAPDEFDLPNAVPECKVHTFRVKVATPFAGDNRCCRPLAVDLHPRRQNGAGRRPPVIVSARGLIQTVDRGGNLAHRGAAPRRSKSHLPDQGQRPPRRRDDSPASRAPKAQPTMRSPKPARRKKCLS